MVERRDRDAGSPDDRSAPNRRTILQATAASSLLPAVGKTVGASPSTTTGSTPDVTISNLTDRSTSVTLSLVGVTGADGDAGMFDDGAPSEAVSVAADADAQVTDLESAFDGNGPQAMAADGSVELRVDDGRGTVETLSIPVDVSASDHIVNVVLYPDETTVSMLHFDRTGAPEGSR